MTTISYAQNYEDVTLLRALGHIGKGFYIDVYPYPNEEGAIPDLGFPLAVWLQRSVMNQHGGVKNIVSDLERGILQRVGTNQEGRRR